MVRSLRPTLLTLLTLLTTVLVLLASACAGDTPTSQPDPVAQAAAGSAEPASPLEASLGFPSDPERRQYEIIQRQRAADVAIVQCMEQAGFFYAVPPAEDALRSGAFLGDGSRDWTIANGLGITTSFVDALAADEAQSAPGAAASNQAYVQSLTEQQSVDYDRALIGQVAPVDATGEYTPGGCFADSFNDILRLLAVIDEFDVKLTSLNSRLNADPRVVAFQQEWSACMRAGGFNYLNENAMVDDIYARLLAVELGENQAVSQIDPGTVIDDLLTYERQVAIAGFDCRQGFAPAFEKLRYDYEREFLDDNRFRIAELVPAPAS